jgi:hypothetical protein
MSQTMEYFFQFLLLNSDYTTTLQKAERTKTKSQQKEIEGRLHVIEVEALISIKLVNDESLPRM